MTDQTDNGTVETTDDLDAFATQLFGQEEITEEPTSPEVVEEEAEQDPVEDEPVEEEDQEEEVVEEPKPAKKTVQERIDELVRQREEAKREGDAKVEQLRKEFEAKFAELQKPQEASKVEEAKEPSPDDVDAEGNPKYSLGEFDPQYVRDLTVFTLNQEKARLQEAAKLEAEQAEQTKAQQELTNSWNEKVVAVKETYPDFQEKGQELVNSLQGLDESYGLYLTNLLMSMDKGPDVLYYLATNPEETASIVNSGAQRATLALGRIEAKFLEPKQAPVTKRQSVAPTPPPPQARSRGANGAFISVPPDTDDLDAFTREFFSKKK